MAYPEPTAGGLTLYSNSTPAGVWEKGWVNVLAYGADPTGTSDSTTAFNNAISAASAYEGTVYVPGGTYLIKSSLSSISNLNLVGDTEATLKFSTQTGYCVTLTSGSLIGMVLWNSDASGSGILNVTGTAFCQNLNFQGANSSDPTPITISGTGFSSIAFANCIFNSFTLATGKKGMVYFGTSGAVSANLSNLNFTSCTATVDSTMALFYVAAGVTDFQITGTINTSSSYKYGCYIASGASNRYIVAHNDFSGAATAAVNDGGSGTNKFVDDNPLRTFAITPAIQLGTTASAGSATTLIRSDSTIVAFDTTAPTTSNPGDSASTGSATVAARRDHVHGREAQFPAGSVVAFAGSSAPSGWLLCDHSAVSRTTYATLFGVIGTTYGSGDGSTTFNVPDLRGRTILGVGSVGTNGQPTYALAATDGGKTVSITTDQMPNHSHSHSHTQHDRIGSQNVGNIASGGVNGITDNPTTATRTGTDATPSGNGNPVTTISPLMAMNWIVKT